MKKIIFVIKLIVGLPLIGFAQTQTYSLEQAMEAGVQNRFDVSSGEYQIEQAENQIQKSKKVWLPTIEAEGNIQYNTHISPTYVPKGFAGFDEPGLLSLGAKNQTVLGLGINQPILQPGINTDIKIAQIRKRLSEETLRDFKIEIRNNIAMAYLNVLLKKLQNNIAKNEEARLKRYAELAEGAYNNGVVIKNNYLRADLDHQNAKIKAKTIQQDYDLAIDYLKYLMNLPSETNIILTDSIEQITQKSTAVFQNENSIENRTEIKQLLLKQEENKLELKKSEQNVLPTISLTGFYGQWYQSQNFKYSESKWWAPQSYIGLKVNIPISDYITNKNNVIENRIRQEQIATDLEQKKADVTFEIHKALTHLENSRLNMESTKNNYQLSQIVYQNQQKQFKIGAFRFSDLLDTERSLHEAEQNYVRSVYDYTMAMLEYKKAMGDL